MFATAAACCPRLTAAEQCQALFPCCCCQPPWSVDTLHSQLADLCAVPALIVKEQLQTDSDQCSDAHIGLWYSYMLAGPPKAAKASNSIVCCFVDEQLIKVRHSNISAALGSPEQSASQEWQQHPTRTRTAGRATKYRTCKETHHVFVVNAATLVYSLEVCNL